MTNYYKIPVIIATNMVKSNSNDDITCNRTIDTIIIKKTRFSIKEIVTDFKLDFADILNEFKYKINGRENVINSLENYGVWIGINNYSCNNAVEVTSKDVQEYLNIFKNSEFKKAYDRLNCQINKKIEIPPIKKMIKEYKKNDFLINTKTIE